MGFDEELAEKCYNNRKIISREIVDGKMRVTNKQGSIIDCINACDRILKKQKKHDNNLKKNRTLLHFLFKIAE